MEFIICHENFFRVAAVDFLKQLVELFFKLRAMSWQRTEIAICTRTTVS